MRVPGGPRGPHRDGSGTGAASGASRGTPPPPRVNLVLAVGAGAFRARRYRRRECEVSRPALGGAPERGDIEDRDPPHLAQAQEVVIGADQVVGLAGHRTLEKLVVRGIPAHADHDLRADEKSPTP